MRVPFTRSSSNSTPPSASFLEATCLGLELVGFSIVLTLWLLTLVSATGTTSFDRSLCADAQLKLRQNVQSACRHVVDTDDPFDDFSDNDQIDQDEIIGLASDDSGLMIFLLASFDPLPGYIGLLHVGEDSPLHSPRAPPALRLLSALAHH
jgi:hypothetical protein